jgi:diguanylate cyclase (GGDEF)-like protein
MGDILNAYHVNILSQRVRVHGTITYYQPGSAMVLQNGARSLWVMTTLEEPLRIGSQADVSGFPDVHDGFLALAGGEVRPTAVYAPLAPRPVTWRQLASSKNVFDLVKIEGQVVTEVRENSQDEYVLVADGQMFSAIYRHPEAGNLQLPPEKQIPLGSRVSVDGICILENSNPFDHAVPFSILMRTPDDIAVVARPSLVNVRNLILIVGLLLTGLIGLGFRSWALERRMRRHTSALASLERQRSRILEDINGSRALAEILEEITQLVSLKLKEAPCWCQIADGARLGTSPQQTAALRVILEEIPARSGPPLGTILAGLDPLTKPGDDEAEALSMGAALATLAIETRRLYSDLRHRSEFDLLTDILNRFSLETRLDAQIDEARQQARVFGLIYIDLDRFKLVNDIYGHQVGDLYLQEASLRMKQQLRSHDLLARLGGDEFAALVPVVRKRAEVGEIAERLERSFDSPFEVEGLVLHGSASVGFALYPEDGATRDSLLSAADAAMYAAKHSKQ